MNGGGRGRILVVHAVPDAGGATRVAIDDAKSLSSAGYEVGFAVDRTKIFEELAGQAAFHRLFLVNPDRYSRLVRYAFGLPLTTLILLWLVVRHRYGSLYVQHRQSGWPSLIVSRLTGSRYVFLSHSELGTLNQARWLTPLGRDIIAVAEHVKQNIITYFHASERDVTVIPNAVAREGSSPSATDRGEFDQQWNLSPPTRVVACVARLDTVKGHDVLLRAWTKVVSCVKDAVLLLAGNGPEREALVRMCVESGIASSVRFLGFVSDPSAVYSRADVVVLASRSEGMPLSILEAFAHGVPVVATSVPGVREVVSHGITGLLVPVDDADRLASAVLEVLSNPTMRGQMSQAGRTLAKGRYSMARRGAQLSSFFEGADRPL